MAKEQKIKNTTANAAEAQAIYPTYYDVKVHTLRPEGTCKANASVNINGCFAVRGVKIMESSKGLFVSMPSYRAGNGEYKDICFPCTKEARAAFDHAVLTAYQQALEQSAAPPRQSPPDPTQQPVPQMQA